MPVRQLPPRPLSHETAALTFVYRSRKTHDCLHQNGRVVNHPVDYDNLPRNITTPRTDMRDVVSENGIANLKGRSAAERARALIGLAHLELRKGLERDARTNSLIPRCFWQPASRSHGNRALRRATSQRS